LCDGIRTAQRSFTSLPLGRPFFQIEVLADSLHFPLAKLFVVDGSQRSAHSNAYFFGLCGKRIVIYDTLIEQVMCVHKHI
jgi:STE24 endopeptidase